MCERCGAEPVLHERDGLWLGALCDEAVEDERLVELLWDTAAA